MKKLRIAIRIITGILVFITLSGIILLIVNPNRDPLDTTYEIIAFVLGAAGMVMAIVAQVDSYQNEKQSRRVLSAIEALNREHDDNDKVDRQFQKKLDALIQMDQRIYRKVSEKHKAKGKS